jgi:hypothetical protein
MQLMEVAAAVMFVFLVHCRILACPHQNESRVARLMVLNAPLALSSKLRPELAAYKAPLAFMRPKSVSCVDPQCCSFIKTAGLVEPQPMEDIGAVQP